MTVLTESLVNALLYYIGDPTAYPGMPHDKKAYCTLNTLFYGDIVSERARIKEGRMINPEIFSNKETVCAFIYDLINSTIGGGKEETEETVFRVARISDVDAMIHAEKTMSFTSTSKKGFLKEYSDKDGLVLLELQIPPNTPRADIAKLIPRFYKREEAEVLLPPWLPVSFCECDLSDDELQIRDRLGNPPVKKYHVKVGEYLEPVDLANDYSVNEDGAEAGKRVINALMAGSEPEAIDEAKYIAWKKSIISEVIIKLSYRNLCDALFDKMESVQYITGITISNLFDATQCRSWIKALLGVNNKNSFSFRIDNLPDERVIHTVATYLLGSYLRDELCLSFNCLPRIFSRNNKVGDPFPFFWALMCLGHDIGYEYEVIHKIDNIKKYDIRVLRLPCALRDLLGLSNNKCLLELERSDLKYLGLTDAECEWAEKSIRMANNYYLFRLDDPLYRCVDHGIVGALILFDELLKIAENRSTNRNSSNRKESMYNNSVSSGYASVNNQHSRFLACSILVSLAVARHNMWVVDNNPLNEKEKKRLQDYIDANLSDLIIAKESDKLSINDPLDQLLFFLDYMDTIDPVKAVYIRHYNDKGVKIENWINYLMKGVQIGCCKGTKDTEHLIQFKFDISGSIVDSKSTISSYALSVGSMADWLNVGKKPESSEDKISIYLPLIEKERTNSYRYGITNYEIVDLCIYQGIPDNSRPGVFYNLPNAYQTLNLLMMDGLDGEKIRIGIEKQTPNSIFIKYWERTIDLFRNSFSAQCKYLKNGGVIDLGNYLHRMDRLINANQMIENGKTIAFTSTTKAEWLSNFIFEKKDPVVETIQLLNRVPAFDYQEVLGDDYAYTDEEEVLLPPFLKINRAVFGREYHCEPLIDIKVKPLELVFEGMGFEPYSFNDKMVFEDFLYRYSSQAADTLDSFIKDPNTIWNANIENCKAYIEWKRTLKRLVNIELSETYLSIIGKC